MSKTDYDLTKIKAVIFDIDGVLSTTCIPLGADGIPCRMANLHDGYAIKLAITKGLKIAIISGCNDLAVKIRFEALGVKDIFFTNEAKVDVMNSWLQQNGLLPEEVAYVGDDIPDYECMSRVGLAVAPHDAATEIKDIARYITHADGGKGVGRELLEQILKARNQWPVSANANGF